MMENPVISAYSKFDLRRLWPVVSATLYPETEKRVMNTVDDVRKLLSSICSEEDGEKLTLALNNLGPLLEEHYKKIEEIVTQRLSIHQVGGRKFPAGYFANACESVSLSASGIKTAWNNIHTLSRRCLGKSNSTAEEKLALAKMNALEQDILYVLFVEHHYLRPLILKGTGDQAD